MYFTCDGEKQTYGDRQRPVTHYSVEAKELIGSMTMTRLLLAYSLDKFL